MVSVPESPVGETPADDAPTEAVRYVGLATRVLSFVIDAAIINLVAIVIGIGAVLIQGVLHLPHNAQVILEAIGAGVYVLGSIAYFVVFWSATGQTPGARVMQIRVLSADGEAVKPRRAIVRCAGVVLAALPLFAGFVLILFDRERRGLQDRLARTVVVEAPQLSIAQVRRLKRQAAYEQTPRGNRSSSA